MLNLRAHVIVCKLRELGKPHLSDKLWSRRHSSSFGAQTHDQEDTSHSARVSGARGIITNSSPFGSQTDDQEDTSPSARAPFESRIYDQEDTSPLFNQLSCGH